MCGILGFVRRDLPNDRLAKLAETWAGTIHHRGPDSGGVWVDADHGLAFAHRRLAIQDLSEHGAQPMHSASGRYVIVYNGELYNFRELSSELADKGHRFSGHSDTEVLLAAVEEWGLQAALERFNGMFAFALWDRETHTIHLGRDRFGEKPLYYGWVGGCFIFASELKPIIEGFRGELEVDRDAVAGFMRHGYISAPRSIFKGIHKLPPATSLTLPGTPNAPSDFSPQTGEGSHAPVRYWDVTQLARDAESGRPTEPDDAVDRLDSLLHEIIRGQSIADVPLGTFLSGGIDSTTVTAILQAESSQPARTFTIGFDEGDFNEAEFAKEIAAHLGTAHTELYVGSRDCLDLIPRLSEIYDEPFSDSSQIPTYLVSKLAREQVTVCLSGDGGDELFAGYNRYLHAESLHRRFSKLPGAVRRQLGAAIHRIPPGRWDSLYRMLRRIAPSLLGPQANVGLKVQKASSIMQMAELNEIYLFLMSYWTKPEALVHGAREGPSLYHDPKHHIPRPFIEQAMLWDQLGYLPGDNLTKVDRASMAVSLETRLPLLDPRVAELSWQLPLDLKVREGQSKWLLRQVLYRYVPRELIERPKMGFSVPVGAWLRGALRDWAESLLSKQRLEEQGFLDANLVRTAWEQHVSGEVDLSQPLWTVLMFQDWIERYGFRSA